MLFFTKVMKSTVKVKDDILDSCTCAETAGLSLHAIFQTRHIVMLSDTFS